MKLIAICLIVLCIMIFVGVLARKPKSKPLTPPIVPVKVKDVNPNKMRARRLKQAVLDDDIDAIKKVLSSVKYSANGIWEEAKELGLQSSQIKPEVAKLLVEAGVDRNNFDLNPCDDCLVKNDNQAKPEMSQFSYGFWYLDVIGVKNWLAAGGNVNIVIDSDGSTPLHRAVGHGEKGYDPTIYTEDEAIPTPAIITMLLEQGADVNAKDNKGQTPLYRALGWSNVSVLLDYGASVQVQDNDGDTPLHAAAWKRYKDKVELFLKRGADVNARNHKGQTALHILPATSFFDSEFTDQQREIEKDLTVAKVLLAGGADVNAKDNQGQTPLMIARKRGYKDFAKLLRENGAQ